MHMFIPLTDEMLFDHPEQINGPLVPFSVDFPCDRAAGTAPRDQESCNELRHDTPVAP